MKITRTRRAPKKLVIKKHEQEDTFGICDRFSSMSFKEYADNIDRYTNKQIQSIYKEVFNKECTVHTIWAKYQVLYELSRQNLILSGQKISTTFKAHYAAAMNCAIDDVGDALKTLIPIEIKYNEQNKESNMNKINSIKKAAEAKKSKCIGITTGLTVYKAWVHCFVKNAKEHKPDEEITKFLLEEFPDHQIKSFHAVHACRTYYNNGRFTDGVKPAVKSVRYNADGTVWQRAGKSAKAETAAPAAAAKKPSTVAKKPAVKRITIGKAPVAKKSAKVAKKPVVAKKKAK